MGKVKSWAWDCAEEQVDDIIKSVKLGKITKEQAKIDAKQAKKDAKQAEKDAAKQAKKDAKKAERKQQRLLATPE